ncbi:response regulator [Pelagicoccus sp. SDUM812002]|uniref:response regulator n=1 Tax=Pelagicoccus sp. SDUM812002 TaxID=3041266 RepID=UPI00280E822D|nr:response regulator [Pelagicoccus sp. SDUM812002]MDQ8186222.1 response regulator [Pelagicoccus sp. SDUM812002]
MERLNGNRDGEKDTMLEEKSKGRRVLLVEDDKNQRRMCSIAFKLKFPQHEMKAAGTAREALEIAREFRPNVILVDFGLPDMDGCELCGCLRGEAGLSDSIVISLSGRGEPADFRRSENAGFTRHMVKPPDLDLLESWFHD